VLKDPLKQEASGGRLNAYHQNLGPSGPRASQTWISSRWGLPMLKMIKAPDADAEAAIRAAMVRAAMDGLPPGS
jgi:hypothetical protein